MVKFPPPGTVSLSLQRWLVEIPHFCEPAGPRPGLCFFEGGWQAVSMCDNVLYQISEDPVSPSAEEWKKEAYKAYVAREQAFEAEESERRRLAGQVAIWLDRSPA